jgi:hypothetical protein
MRAMGGEPLEVKWLLDHANERDGAEYRARYDEQASSFGWAIAHNGKSVNRGVEAGGEKLDTLLRAYRKIRDAKEAAREAEERKATRKCEEQRRAFPPMGAPPTPHPGGRPPTERDRVIKEMHATPAEYLDTMKLVEMESRYKAGVKLCKHCRAAVQEARCVGQN